MRASFVSRLSKLRAEFATVLRARCETTMDAGAGSNDAEPAFGAASGCEGCRRVDEAHAECEAQGEMAWFRRHGCAGAV